MKFDLTTNLFDLATIRIVQLATPNTPVEPLSLAQMLMQLLLTNTAGAAQPTPEVKVKHYQLMTKVLSALDDSNGIIDLSIAEISIIKALADANCPTLVHGRLSHILENQTTPRIEAVN